MYDLLKLTCERMGIQSVFSQNLQMCPKASREAVGEPELMQAQGHAAGTGRVRDGAAKPPESRVFLDGNNEAGRSTLLRDRFLRQRL